MDFVENALIIMMGLSGLCMILLLGSVIIIAFTPFGAEWDCTPYANEGHDVKVVPLTPFGYECWINHDDTYIPLEKWINVNLTGE